jgi:hypothetical protein
MLQQSGEMVNFLFWNLNRQENAIDHLCDCLTELVMIHEIHILIIAEATPTLRQRFLHHCRDRGLEYSEVQSLQPQVKTHIFSCYPQRNFRDLVASDRMRGTGIKLGNLDEILLFSLHLCDARNHSPDDQNFASRPIASQIRTEQKKEGHCRSIVVGDFNMNPFDTGMIDPDGFHAVMDRAIAQREGRNIYGELYPYFYNPTWHLMGNQVARVPGSYYFIQPKVTQYWYTLDQVLVGSDLIPKFMVESLELLTQVKNHHLLTSLAGKPRKSRYSDHLPLKFSLFL